MSPVRAKAAVPASPRWRATSWNACWCRAGALGPPPGRVAPAGPESVEQREPLHPMRGEGQALRQAFHRVARPDRDDAQEHWLDRAAFILGQAAKSVGGAAQRGSEGGSPFGRRGEGEA